MNALRPAAEGEGGFTFAGPYRLDDKPGRAEQWQETLERAGRLHPVSGELGSLLNIGVRQYCWLRPHEEMTPHEGKWPNGAFAFFYDDPQFNCVFRLSKVLPPSEDKIKRTTSPAISQEKSIVKFECSVKDQRRKSLPPVSPTPMNVAVAGSNEPLRRSN